MKLGDFSWDFSWDLNDQKSNVTTNNGGLSFNGVVIGLVLLGFEKKPGRCRLQKKTTVNSEHVRSGKNPKNRGLALTPVVFNSKGGVRNFTFSLESDSLTNHVLKVEALD